MPTSPPTAPVQICNLALDYLGESPVSSIENPTDQREEIMARWYDHVRMTVLREFVWNFAQNYTVLTRSGDGLGGHTDKYNLPNDCVRVNSVGSDPYNGIREYDIFGREIHCSEGTSLPIWYNKNVVDVPTMDPLFVNVLALRLAIKTAYKFTKKKSVVESLSALLKLEEPKATSVDGQEKVPRRIQRSRYLSARKYGTTSNPKYYEYNP